MIRTFKCSGCGGNLIYAAGTDHLICIQCGKTTAFPEIDFTTDLSVPVEFEGTENAGDGKTLLQCVNCGAELSTDKYTASTVCTYCGSPMLIESRLSGEAMPAKILPFAFDKKRAQENFKTWKGTGFLTPSSFKSNATMDKVQGIYVPYWLYQLSGDVNLKGMGTMISTVRQGDEIIEYRDNYAIDRTFDVAYENVPENASHTWPKAELEVLEPYDFKALTDFAVPYLMGFYADQFGKTKEEMLPDARRAAEEDAIMTSRLMVADYHEVNIMENRINMTRQDADYTFLPLWALNFKYGGKNYPLYMNGQTGKIEGELPVSKGKLWLLGFIVFVIIFLITFLLGRGL